MKQELLRSVSTVLNAINGINVNGRDNIFRMADVIQVLEGMSQYISRLPDEVEETE